MNWLEATRFLMLTMDEDELRKSKLNRIMPRRRKKPGQRIEKLALTTANSLEPSTNDQTQWVWPDVVITKEEKKEVFARVVEQFVQIFCETQTYTWRGRFLSSDS